MSLTQFFTQIQELSLMQKSWAAQLNPIVNNPLLKGNALTGVKLASGVNTINHLLARKQQGWIITDIDAAATIYRSQPFNDVTLTLTSSAACTVNIYCY